MLGFSQAHSVFSPVAHSLTRTGSRRIATSCRRSSAASLPAPPQAPDLQPTPSSDSILSKFRASIDDFSNVLSRPVNPSRVWAQYISLLSVLGYEQLPLEIHQEVLRRCTPSSAELRVSAPRRLLAGNKPANPHLHEARFQTVIRNIRAIGVEPTLDDYHFILEQFAAVGHHVGAMQVYKELLHVGLTPGTKTFGLCLQTIAHRLTLPIFKDNRVRMIAQMNKMLADLMHDMRKYETAFTSVNFDLTIRILKETLDREAFESLMKWGYGIDMANPDRIPLEYLESSDVAGGILGANQPSAPVPFSTAALNTTIDMLGRLGDISKLVQAFEVLTQPLPKASQHFFSSFDDDEDFGVIVDEPSSLTFKLPHASPNTTTYNTLLRHVCRGGHAVLARHYLLQAIDLDRKTSEKLRKRFLKIPRPKVILAPHFAVNRGTLISVFGESNRDKNLGLMRWLSTKIPRILRNKESDLAFFYVARNMVNNMSSLRRQLEGLHTAARHGSAFLPHSSVHSVGAPVTSRTPIHRPSRSSIFDVSLDDSSAPPPSRIKYFDVDAHISILERDLREIKAFALHLEDIIGRTTQRIKERLGRRVWAGRDLYLASEGGSRSRISRTQWQAIVKFRPRQSLSPEADRSRVSPGLSTAGPLRIRASAPYLQQRSFSTLDTKDNNSPWNGRGTMAETYVDRMRGVLYPTCDTMCFRVTSPPESDLRLHPSGALPVTYTFFGFDARFSAPTYPYSGKLRTYYEEHVMYNTGGEQHLDGIIGLWFM